MKTRWLLILALATNYSLNGQVDVDWVIQLDRIDIISVLPKSIHVDKTGNYYLMGQSGSISLDMDTLPEIRNVGRKRGFIAKLGEDGEPSWLKDDSIGYLTVQTVIDENDYFHVVKHFGPSTFDILYSRHDTAWSVLDHKPIVELVSTGGSADLYDLAVEENMLYIAFNGVQGVYSIGGVELRPEGHTLYVAKYSITDDSLVYLHQIQSEQISYAHITLDSKGNLFVISDFYDSLKINSEEAIQAAGTCSNCPRLHLTKVSKTGELISTKVYHYGGVSARQVLVKDSKLYIVGHLYGGTYTFDQIQGFSYGGPFILQLSDNLEAESYRGIGITGFDSHAKSFDFLDNGSIIVTGGYQGKKITENGDTLPSDGYPWRQNSFIALLDSSMTNICMTTIAANYDNYIDYIKVASDRILLTGHYNCEVNIGNSILESSCEYGNLYQGYFADISSSTFCQQTVTVSEIESNANNYTIYPNPSSGVFRISCKEGNRFSVQVYDSYGNLILAEPNWYSESSIQLESPGIYMVRIKDQYGEFICKLINT